MIETLYRSQDGAVEVYRRADGQARLVVRKPGFTGEVKAQSFDLPDDAIERILDELDWSRDQIVREFLGN